MNSAKKGESKGRGHKAIIGVAMAAIMLAFVMVAMVPTISAKVLTSEYTTVRNGFDVNPTFVVLDITDGDRDPIKIGQEIIFANTVDGDVVMIQGREDTNTDGEAFSASAFVTEPVGGKTVSGIYFDATMMGRTGTYDVYCGGSGKRQALSVSRPAIPIELKVGPEVVSTICAGTRLRVDCSGATDLNPYDCVDLIITDPRGRRINSWTIDGQTQKFDDINIAQLVEYGSTNPAKQIDTTDWLLGTYTFEVETEEENARGFDLSSPTKTLVVLKGEVDIDVDKTEVGELQSVTVTITGIYGHTIHVEATAGKNFVEFEDGLDDFADTFNRGTTYVTDPVTGTPVIDPATGNSKQLCYGFDVRMEEDGQMQFSVRFYDTGAYTIEAIDTDTGDEDTVDVKVSEKEVIFDMPATVVIGDDLEIRGTSNAGDYIDIAVKDYIVYTGIPIEADGTFEEDLRTPETRGTGAPGSIVIEAFIRVAGDLAPPLGKEISDEEEDGSVSILLTTGSLATQLSTTNVAQEDSFTVYCTAAGSDFVDIVTIAPKGGSGRGINPASVPDVPGITYDSSTVSDIDYGYLKELYVDEDADTGRYMVVVVSPGCNGVYNGINSPDLFGSAEFDAAYGDLASKTQAQILATIENATVDAAGSDDLLWVGCIRVGAPKVSLNPIAGVTVGEPLVVTGTSNREAGSTIIVTATGPIVLEPQTVQIENGMFEATFDTTSAEKGTYTVKADDGDGHTDEATVKILPAITPTTMRLYKTWNFISVPKKLADGNNTFEHVFGDVDTFEHSIYYYNATKGWSAVNATEEVKPLSGYRIYSVEAMVVNLTYDTYPLKMPPTRALYKGWNAIGFSDTKATAANSALTSIEKNWAYLIGFNADKQEYEAAIINNDKTGGIHDEDNLMYPMKGYLIYVTEDCALAGISA